MPRMKLLAPFNGRQPGAVMECSLQVAAKLESDKYGEETSEPVTPNPGASEEAESLPQESPQEPKAKRGRPKKERPDEPESADD